MGKKILVVDDEVRIVDLVTSMLTKHGYDVVSASDGEEALDQVREQRPDLVLLDIMMPKMDGTTVAEELRSRRETERLPVVFLTSLVEDAELQQEGDEIGGHLFLAKPFNLPDLLSVIDRAMRRAAY